MVDLDPQVTIVDQPVKSTSKIADSVPVSFRDALVPPSPRVSTKSFADVINSLEDLPEPTFRDGKPGIQFPDEVISSLIEPFKFALVGKITGNRSTAPNSMISTAFSQMGFKTSFTLKFLPRGYLVITLSCEEDFARLWTKGGIFVGTVGIRFSKWTPEFKFEEESPIAPVWVRFPELPLHLYNKKSLYAIARILGNPIKLDEHTAERSRGAFARVCVEMNVLDERIKHVWVGWGDHTQGIEVVYEKVPSFCTDCKMLGHSTSVCYSHGKNPRPPRPKPFVGKEKVVIRNPPPQPQEAGPSVALEGPAPFAPGAGNWTTKKRRRNQQRRPPPQAVLRIQNAFQVLESLPEEPDLCRSELRTEAHFEPTEQSPDLHVDGDVVKDIASGSSDTAMGGDAGAPNPQSFVAPHEGSDPCLALSWARQVGEEVGASSVVGEMELGFPKVVPVPDFEANDTCTLNHSSHSIPSLPGTPVESSAPFFEGLVSQQGTICQDVDPITEFVSEDDSSSFCGTESCDGRDFGRYDEDFDFSCLIWNIRGLRSSESQERLHALVKEKRVKILAILEPMIALDQRFMTRRLGFQRVLSNVSGHIWVFFADDVKAECVLDHAQFLHLRVSAPFLPTPVFCSFVYAKCDYILRHDLWASLLQVKPVGGPWLVGGDFNVVRDASECLGSSGGRQLPMDEFNHFVLDSALVDAGFEGSSFTWTNKSIWKRLDRVFVSVDWGDHFNSIRVEHLSRTVSDHCPLLLSAPVFAWGPSLFRFQSMWTRHPGFLQTVRLNWNMPCALQGMPRLFAKLKRLKGHLKWWNRDVFGNRFDKIAEAERSVRLAEAACEADSSEHSWTLLSRCNEELSRVTAMEADFWKQKAACNWLEDGERNTKLFHNMVKKKNVVNKIFRIWEDGNCLTSPGLIKQSGAAYFERLLTGDPFVLDLPDFSGFFSEISEEENHSFAAEPSLEEVRAVVFSIPRDSVAGPDGFSSAFFQSCWDFVQHDVMDAVLDFFRGSLIAQGFTATTITLIPKVEGAQAWTDFRPISLCNVSNKIISKLLYSRLRSVVGKLVSQSQSGFVPGRMIADNILLAHELTHSLNLPARGGNVILKLDMAKAYDRVQWSFLLDVLRRFGFSEQVVRMVRACISFCKFSVNVNGTPAGFFASSRGLRQGDPLSPLLFVLGAEYLSRGLDRLFLQHADLRYRSGCDLPISHLAYADDVIIFANGGSRGLQRLKDFLAHYENCSGQLVNVAKSAMIFPPGWTARRRSRLLQITGFAEGHLPLKYLGAPLFRGNHKCSLFEPLLQSVRKKLEGWESRSLAPGSRMTLIRSVLL
ncbi:uncharacterized protein [Henckelia pumila]|uniref:uncharacterized protein n=1 Tax=Henckelia pumila TaxID=405737 RepID=UPI003C6E4CCF